jgi:hypothetical protein
LLVLVLLLLLLLLLPGIIKGRGIQPMFGQRKHVGWLIARGVTGELLARMCVHVWFTCGVASSVVFTSACKDAAAAAVHASCQHIPAHNELAGMLRRMHALQATTATLLAP